MEETRMEESRYLMLQAFYMAIGSYTEQEAKKEDRWRDQDIGQLYAHLHHEVEEIRTNLKRNDTINFLLHNCMDAVSLSLMLMVKVMERIGLTTKDDLVKDWGDLYNENHLLELKIIDLIEENIKLKGGKS